MNNFDFYNPVRVHFGPGSVKDTGKLAEQIGKRVCLVSYKELGPLESLCEQIVTDLKAKGLAVFTFFRAEPPDKVFLSQSL